MMKFNGCDTFKGNLKIWQVEDGKHYRGKMQIEDREFNYRVIFMQSLKEMSETAIAEVYSIALGEGAHPVQLGEAKYLTEVAFEGFPPEPPEKSSMRPLRSMRIYPRHMDVDLTVWGYIPDDLMEEAEEFFSRTVVPYSIMFYLNSQTRDNNAAIERFREAVQQTGRYQEIEVRLGKKTEITVSRTPFLERLLNFPIEEDDQE